MSRRSTWVALVVAGALAGALALPATASAIDMRESNAVVVARGETVSDDLYAFGNTITIDGTVDGDVVAFGQMVTISGDVRGSVLTAAQTVRIDGTVDGSVRAAGQLVDVSGSVNGDVLAGSSQVTVGGDVARDVAAGAQNVTIDGTVGRNLMTSSSSLTISGDVGGNVEAQSADVKVTRQGTVDGNLDYWSADKAVVVGEVSGTTTRHDPPTNGKDTSAGGGGGVLAVVLGAILAWIQSLVGLLVLGLVMVFALRRPVTGGSQAVADRLGVSLGVGVLVFFTTPMVGGFIFVVGLFIGAWWLAFVLFAVYWLLLLAGLIVGGLAVGRAILSRASSSGEPALAWSLVLGLVLVWLVAAVPLLGWLAAWLVMLAGTGGLVLLWMGKTEAPSKPIPAEVAPQLPVA
jgi:cytoskeletal protein CcmA (bactofilin family)